jgi:hypothetical protein
MHIVAFVLYLNGFTIDQSTSSGSNRDAVTGAPWFNSGKP